MKNIKILVVEDEGIVAEDIKDTLQELGYIVTAIADSGELAIKKAAETKPSLVLMDIRLKGKMDGLEAAAYIWNYFRIPIVYLTANSDLNTLKKVKKTEPFGYLTKPFKERELHTTIEVALHRYQFEKQLKEREQWLNTILTSIGDGVIATDHKNCITFLNPVAEALTGWKCKEAIGKNSAEVFNITHEQTRIKIDNPVIKALQLGKVVNIPEKTLLIDKNGGEIPIDDSAAPIKNQKGQTTGAVIIFREIIKRKRAERRLIAHHNVTRILAESTTLTEAISKLLQTICVTLEWDLGEFWIIEQQTNVLRYVENWHLPRLKVSEFEVISQHLTFSPGVGVLGATWNTGKPVWITELNEDPIFVRKLIAKKVGFHTIFSLPVISDSEVIAVMTFFSCKSQQPDPELLQMIATIGNQIGQFIKRKHSEEALKQSEQRLAWQSKHDSLTGLVNRAEFEERLEVALSNAKTENQQYSLCYLDLDQFKIVNDTCGHMAGDELLRQVASLLRSQVRITDTLARLGGDEFGLLLNSCCLEQAEIIANNLCKKLQEFRFFYQDKTFGIGVSIGLVAIDAKTLNLGSALSVADAACYAAKNAGRNRVHVYQVNDSELAIKQSQMQWLSRLSQALEENHFCLYSQPIVSIAHPEVKPKHYEILLRLQDETGNLVLPMAFIPAAERYNLMHTIDRWVISTLFANLGQHYRQQKRRDCKFAVNLSGASINDEKFIHFLHEQFKLHDIPPQLICFEITETIAIKNLGKARQLIKQLKNIGCSFSLDDFGSGMSSFAYLKNLPVDYLKIDGGFVRDIVSDQTDLALIEAINRVGHVMGIQTIAEFVENNAILELLRDLKVDYAQGYGIAKPLPLKLEEILL